MWFSQLRLILVIALPSAASLPEEEGSLLQARSITVQGSGACQRVLDKCSISQKMPVVGHLITNTFKDCVQTFNKVGLIQGQGKNCAKDSQDVRAWWQAKERADTMTNDFILMDDGAETWLESTHDAFDAQPDIKFCDAGLAYLTDAVTEASGTLYPAGSTPNMAGKVAWKPGDVLQMMGKAKAVCTCLTGSSLLQTSQHSVAKSRAATALAVSVAHLKTISGFYMRSATAFDEFAGKFEWLPEAMLQTLRQYIADRHVWAGKMAKSAEILNKCPALLQAGSSMGACLENGLNEAVAAAEKSIADAKQMSEIVEAWSSYVPLCSAFIQFATELPSMYESLFKSVKSALLLQMNASSDLTSTISALNTLNDGLVSLSRNK